MTIALKKVRELKGLSVPQLSEKSGIPKGTLWGWEAGRRSPDPSELLYLSEVLGCSIHKIVTGEDYRTGIGAIVDALDSLPDKELNYLKAVVELKLAERYMKQRT